MFRCHTRFVSPTQTFCLIVPPPPFAGVPPANLPSFPPPIISFFCGLDFWGKPSWLAPSLFGPPTAPCFSFFLFLFVRSPGHSFTSFSLSFVSIYGLQGLCSDLYLLPGLWDFMSPNFSSSWDPHPPAFFRKLGYS